MEFVTSMWEFGLSVSNYRFRDTYILSIENIERMHDSTSYYSSAWNAIFFFNRHWNNLPGDATANEYHFQVNWFIIGQLIACC